MNINFNKIERLYGQEMLQLIINNIDDVKNNIAYLIKHNIDNIEEIFEDYAEMFICLPEEFKEKIDKFILKLGNNYLEMLENNVGLWGEIE